MLTADPIKKQKESKSTWIQIDQDPSSSSDRQIITTAFLATDYFGCWHSRVLPGEVQFCIKKNEVAATFVGGN